MPVLTNPKRERFAQELASGKTQVEAYVAAGYKANDSNAAQMAKRPEITDRVTELNGRVAEKIMEKTAVDRAWVLDMLARNARIAMGDEEITRKVLPRGAKETLELTVTDRDAAAANRALELVGKEFGMFIQRHEVGTPGEFAALLDDIDDETRDNGVIEIAPTVTA